MTNSFSNLNSKIDQVKVLIQSLTPVAVAYSGGVDSTLIAKLAVMETNEEALIVIAKSPSLSSREFEKAVSLAQKHNFNLQVIHTKEMEIENYQKNPPNRCYFCKVELYKQLKFFLGGKSRNILDGTNVDDLNDVRPGREAAKQNDVISPLVEIGFNKKEVRLAAKSLGLENWNKPATACLSSRFPHLTPISREKLSQVEKAEEILFDLEIPQVRVRHHNKVARIEVSPEDFEIVLKHRQKIYQAFLKLGYSHTSLDIIGFRSGSFNEKYDLNQNV